MAKSPTYKINIDTGNLKQVVAHLDELAKSQGKIGEQSKKLLEPIRKLLISVENESKVTKSQLEATQKSIDSLGKDLSETYTKYVNQLKTANAEMEKHKQAVEDLKTKYPQLWDAQKKAFNKEFQLPAPTKKSKDEIFEQAKKEILENNKIYQENKDYFNRYSSVNIGSAKTNLKENDTEENARRMLMAELIAKYRELTKAENERFEKAEVNWKKEKKYIVDTIDKYEELQTQIDEVSQVLGIDASGKIKKKLPTEGLDKIDSEINKAHAEMDVTGVTAGSYNPVENNLAFNKATKSLLRSGVVLQLFKKLVNESVKAVRELDDAITNMTVVTGESREETEKYVASFAKIAQATSATINEIADLTTEFVRQGRSVADAMTLAEETAKAAKIAGISVRDSLTYMTSAINGFNLAAEDAAHVSDVFAKLAAVSATDYNQLAVALSKVSAQANQAGMSIEYTTALLAKGIETTQEAPESIGTALKTIIARFRELSDYGSTLEDGMDVNKVEKALNAVGISLRDDTGAFRDLSDVLNELGPMWDDLNTMQRQAIAQAAAGTRQQSRFLAIMQDWERTMELVDTAQNAAGASAAQYSKYAKGMTASLTNLKSAYQAAITSFTESEWVINTINVATDTLSTIGKIIDKTGSLLPGIATTAAVIAGYSFITAKWQQHKLTKLQEELAIAKMTQQENKNAATAYIDAERQKILLAKKQMEEKLELAKQEKLDALRNEKEDAAEAKRTAKEHLTKLENIKQETIAKLESEKATLNAEKDSARIQEIDAELQALNSATSEQNKAIEEARKAYLEADKAYNNAYQRYHRAEKKIDNEYAPILDTYQQQLDSLDLLAKKYSTFGGSVKSILNKIVKSNGFKQVFGGEGFGKVKTEGLKGGAKAGFGQIKNLGKDFLTKNAGTIKMGLSVAAIAAAVVFSIKQINRLVKAEDDALSKISELTSENADKTGQISSLKSLQKEYDELKKKVYLTAEETERLKDIEKELNETYEVNLTGDVDKNINARIRELSGDVGENIQNAMVEAFKVATLKGKDIFENTDFHATIKAQIQASNLGDRNTEQGKAHAETYDKLAANFDSAKYGKDVAEDSKAKSLNEELGATAGVLTAALGIGLAFTPIGWVAAAVGVLAAAGMGIATAMGVARDEAKKTAEQVAQDLVKISNDFNTYSARMAEVSNQSIAEQYSAHISALSDITNEYSQQAIKSAQSMFTAFKEMGLTSKDLEKMQLKNADGTFGLTNEAMSNLIDKANTLGEEAAKAFVSIWQTTVEKGVSSTELASVLSLTLSGGSTQDVIDELVKMGFSPEEATQMATDSQKVQADFEQRKDDAKAEYDKVQEVQKNTESWDEYLESLGYRKKDIKKMSPNEKRAIIDAEADRLRENYNATNESLDALKESVYDLITPIDNILSLTQALTGMDTATKNAQEFADRLEEGTATLEDWSNAAAQYGDVIGSDEWVNATAEERADMIRNSNDIFSTAERRNEQINKTRDRTELEHRDRINELEQEKADLANNTELTDEEKAAEEERINNLIQAEEDAITVEGRVYDELLKMYDVMTEAQAVQEANTRALSHLDKQIEKGNLLAYDRKNDVLASNLAASSSKLNRQWQNWADNEYFKSGKHDLEKWQKAVQDMYNGNAEAYLELMGTLKESSDQEVLKNMYENYAEYQAEIDEINEQITQNILDQQDAAIEAYKQKMKREYNETKESLDKRKELYEKYFDAIDKEAEEDDYESERSRLLNAIGSLSTSTDMASLNKRKELEKELADLEKERRETERDELRDNVMERIEEQQSEFDKIYEEATENNRAIWQQFTALGEEAILQLMKENAGFENMTFEQQWAFLQNHTNLTDSIDDWIANAGQTYSAEAMKGMNLDQQKAQMIQDFTREYSNVFGDFNFQIDASQVTGTTPEEIARSIFDVFRKEMSKRGITANQKK